MALHDMTLAEAGAKVRSGEISSTELTRAVLERIRAVEPKVDAFLTVMEEEALTTAKRFDETPKAQRPNNPVAGVPIALKDIFCTKGVKTTCASKLLANFIPPYDATVVRKLRDAGAVLVGKLNMDEFAMGSSCENSGFKRTRNPWDLERVPGGSSGGSAAAVAAGMCMGALGTDTGGSIRQPSALSNLVGIKPTYGRVSRYGVIAFASSLDQVGPMCRTAEDAALLLGVIAGHDPNDSTSLDDAVPDYSKSLRQDVKGLRLGVPKEYLIDGMDPEVRALFEKALGQYKDAGAEIIETTLPHTEYGIATYYIIAPAEASSNLSRYDGVRYGVRAKIDPKTEGLGEMIARTRSEGFGKEVQRRIMIGTYVLSAGYYDAFYKKAQQVRTLIRKDFEEAFKKVDLIITPTTPTAAFKIGEKSEDPVAMYLSDVFTVTTNIAGLPGLSMPCGFTKTGLPLGVQLIGAHLAEPAMFRAADAFERMNDYTKRRPSL